MLLIWYRKRFVFKENVPVEDATLYYSTHVEEWPWSAMEGHPIPEDCIVVRSVNRARPTGHHDYKSMILPNHRDDPWEPVQPPWWFVGAQMDDGEIFAVTDMLADFLVVNNRITLDLLERLNYDIPKNRIHRWFYIHPDTFEELEFPSEGIVVKSYAEITRTPEPELSHED